MRAVSPSCSREFKERKYVKNEVKLKYVFVTSKTEYQVECYLRINTSSFERQLPGRL